METAKLLERPWFESPFFEAELERASLPPIERDLLERFARDGYVIFDLDVPDFGEMAGDIIHFLKTSQPGSIRVTDGWKDRETIRRLACHDHVLRLLRLFYRREPFPFQTLNFPVGTEQRAHNDMIHFNSMPERFMCGVWVALEDIDEANGPLYYYPGSHRLPFYDLADLGVGSDLEDQTKYRRYYEPFLREAAEALRLPRVEVRMKRGQALIWASSLIHGGSPIRDRSRTRYTQVTHYYFENCVYYTPLYSDLPIGRIAYRQPTDVRTGVVVPSRYRGVDVRLARADPSTARTEAANPAPPEPSDRVRFTVDSIDPRGVGFDLAGWAFLPGEDARENFVRVVLRNESGSRTYDTAVRERPDVAAYFPGDGRHLESAGFAAFVPRQGLARGRHRIGLWVCGRNEGLTFGDRFLDVE